MWRLRPLFCYNLSLELPYISVTGEAYTETAQWWPFFPEFLMVFPQFRVRFAIDIQWWMTRFLCVFSILRSTSGIPGTYSSIRPATKTLSSLWLLKKTSISVWLDVFFVTNTVKFFGCWIQFWVLKVFQSILQVYHENNWKQQVPKFTILTMVNILFNYILSVVLSL